MPEFEQALWHSRHEIERETCSRCGHPLEHCSDGDRDWFPQRVICYATREREAADALYAELHADAPYHDGTETSWVKERSRTHPYRYDDGVTVVVADYDVAPDDLFLGEPGVDGV